MKKIFLQVDEKNFYHIKHGFFTRLGGYSKKNFVSLDYNLSSSDKQKIVEKNIQFAMKKLGVNNKKLKLPNQIHSNIIKKVNKKNFGKILKADGLITDDFSIALGILTADCTPIFIFDKNKSFICCLHVGWKGLSINIIQNSLKLILDYNKNLDEIIVIIGPCLSKKNFEVGIDFKKKFTSLNSNYFKFFSKKNSKEYFDMRGLINLQFNKLGINNIFNINKDTYGNKELFYSHRRATHRKILETRRMINIISFK